MKTYAEIVMWVVVAMICVLAFGSLINNADAHQLTQEECPAFAQDIFIVASERDNGKALEVERAEDEAIIRAHMGERNFYVKDVEDLDMVLKSVDLLYEYKHLSPQDLSNATLKVCLNAAAQKRVSGE